MRMGVATIAAAAVGLAISGCGGEDDAPDAEPADGSSSSAPPETMNVTVELYDEPPLEVLYNGDGGQCTSNFLGLNASTPSVTLYDADGSIVGTQDLEDEGGTFDREYGCQWTLV